MAGSVVQVLGGLFRGSVSVTQLGGPVEIARASVTAAQPRATPATWVVSSYSVPRTGRAACRYGLCTGLRLCAGCVRAAMHWCVDERACLCVCVHTHTGARPIAAHP